MDFLNFLMALSPIVVVLVGILGFKKSAKTVSPIALAWTLILAFTYFNLDGLTFAENVKVLDPLVWKGHQGRPQDRADGLRRVHHFEPAARDRRH